MKTQILHGKKYQDQIFGEIKNDIGIIPGIAFLAFTNHVPLMKNTIDLHVNAAIKLGFNVTLEARPASATEKEMCEVVDQFNQDDSIQAIILEIPKELLIDSPNKNSSNGDCCLY